MTKVHPNVASAGGAAASAPPVPAVAPAVPVREEKGEAVSLTVWRRSLLFNGKGFTVFDCKGNLVYRVETYAGGSPREVVLMDADGHGLLTIRRKKLSLSDEWLIYDGDAAASPSSSAPTPKRFTARRHVSLLPTRSLAHLSPARCRPAGPTRTTTTPVAPRRGAATTWRARTPGAASTCLPPRSPAVSSGGAWRRCAGKRPLSAQTCSAWWWSRASTRRWPWPSSSSWTRCTRREHHIALVAGPGRPTGFLPPAHTRNPAVSSIASSRDRSTLFLFVLLILNTSDDMMEAFCSKGCDDASSCDALFFGIKN